MGRYYDMVTDPFFGSRHRTMPTGPFPVQRPNSGGGHVEHHLRHWVHHSNEPILVGACQPIDSLDIFGHLLGGRLGNCGFLTLKFVCPHLEQSN